MNLTNERLWLGVLSVVLLCGSPVLAQSHGSITPSTTPLPSALLALNSAPQQGKTETGQTKEDLTRADYLQIQSEKFLMLREAPPVNLTNMPAAVFQQLLYSVEQLRFDVQDWRVDSQETMNWCVSGAAEAQKKAGVVTAKGDALVTLEALIKRCSQIASFTFEAKHECRPGNKENKEADVMCRVGYKVAIRKYIGEETGDGNVQIVLDQTFGDDGTMYITTGPSSWWDVRPKKSFAQKLISAGNGWSGADTAEEALMAAAFRERQAGERAVRDIKCFQLVAPIVHHDADKTFICLGRDQVELDAPFYVVMPTEDGEKRVGFVKARKLYDGCQETRPIENAVYQPSMAQDILGSKKIQVGMSTVEMPSIGLNLGFATGFGMALKANMGFQLGLQGEYNLARHIKKISELYATMGVQFLVMPRGGTAKIGPIVGDKLDLREVKEPSLVARIDMGMMKRWFVRSFFVDAGAAFAVDAYAIDSKDNKVKSVGLASYGFDLKVGLGFQVHPRTLIRLSPVFHYGAVLGNYKDQWDETSPTQLIGHDAGLLLTFDCLFTI